MAELARSSLAILVGVYSARMFTLFILWPVLSLHSTEYQGVTVLLTGIALGIHGLTQALLQIPLGMLSDHIGRKTVIIGGLVVFCIGSLIAASADSIYQVIVGRALQGAGAISSALTAFVADLSSEQQRPRAMAFIGMGIAASFVLALVLANPLHSNAGLSGMFFTTAAITVVAILLVTLLPNIAPQSRQIPKLHRAFASPDLVRLYGGVFCLHATMAANFMLLPTMLSAYFPTNTEDQWMFYLPVLLLSFLPIFPMIALGERTSSGKYFFLLAIVLTIAGQLLWPASANNIWWLGLGVLLFFIGFNYLEANMPALVTRLCDPTVRGGAVGVYSTLQFAGVFVGAAAAGFIIEHWGISPVMMMTVVLLGTWLVFASFMRKVESLPSRG